MNSYNHASELFFSELLRISSDIVWKNSALAKQNEDPAESVYIDQYRLARQGKLTFDLIFSFEYSVLIESGLTQEQAENGSEMSSEIPVEKRDICTKKQIEYVLRTYNEPNNYYRMLNGLPDIGDTDFIYNTKYPHISDSVTPIHLLPSDTIYMFERNGYINELLKEHPDKKYLKYMGTKKIDPYTARNSEDYAILWIDHSDFASLVIDFKEVYNVCRYMITSVFNAQNIQMNNLEYVGFIGMTILFATIIQMNKKFLDVDVTRDFYDQDSLRYIYDSYGVPFFTSIPMEYHKIIVKNINRLISYKGSTNVIFELFNIFGLSDMAIYEFYILRTHKFENGKPIFVKNPDGTYDYKAMYDVKFAKVRLYNDPVRDISDPANHIAYEDMVRNDPYWISDKELLDKIYQEEYNYLDSKYLGVQTTFDMMKILYESCYYLKMIIDNRKLLNNTTIFNNNVKEYVTLFDSVIYICALMCKKYGYEGNIPTDPHEIGRVLGFNFKLDLQVLQNHIKETDYLKNDPKLLNYLSTMSVNSLESVRNVYLQLTELRSYLVNKMAETSIPEEYWAYYELYESIMYSEYVDKVFTKSNGKTAESFADMLKDTNLPLYQRLNADEGYHIDEEISYMLYSLKNSCNALTHIHYMDSINIDIIIEYILKLVDFFKSAKADTTEYNVVYSLAYALDNRIKLMCCIDHMTEESEFVDYIDELSDLIYLYRDITHFRDTAYTLLAKAKLKFTRYFLQSYIDYFDDYLYSVTEIIRDVVSDAGFYDNLKSDTNIFLLEDDEFEMKDMVKLLYDDVREILRFFVKDDMNILDVIKKISDSVLFKNDAEIQSKILHILILQRYKASYKNRDFIPHINTSLKTEFDILFTDKLISELYKYNLFSDHEYVDMVNCITEWIGESKLKSILHINESKFHSIKDVYPIKGAYFELLTRLVSEIYRHYIETDASMQSDLRGLEHYMNISGIRHSDMELASYMCRVKTNSKTPMCDKLVLLHESVIED